jgi:hypothetical protein
VTDPKGAAEADLRLEERSGGDALALIGHARILGAPKRGPRLESFSGEQANNRRFERGLKAILDGYERTLRDRPKRRRKSARG